MRKKFSSVALLLSLLLLSACSGGGGGSSSSSGGTTNPPPAGTTSVSSAGATVTSTDAALSSAKLIIPAGAVPAGQTVNVKMEALDALPSAAPSGAVQSGKIIVLSKDTTNDFSLPVDVTVPFDATKGDVPNVLYWDETNKTYQAVAISNIDSAAGTVSFSTVHFSKYAILQAGSITSSTKGLPAIDTKFKPADDGFFNSNFGSYSLPGGSSYGMVGFSAWYYNYMKSTDTNKLYNNINGLYNKYREGDPNLTSDDITEQTLITKLQTAIYPNWNWALNTNNKLNDKYSGLFLLGAMTLTSQPQILLMKHVDPTSGKVNFGQAVLAYGFTPAANGTSGTFSLYDPNFKGEVVTIDWDMTKGFSNYSKAAAFSYTFNKFSYDAPSSLAENAKFLKLFNDSEATFTGGSTISVTAPTFDANKVYSYLVTDPNAISIPVSGSVSGGTAKYLIWSINGGAPNTVNLSGEAFSFTISEPLNTSNTLSMYATDNLSNSINASGFVKYTIKTTGVSVTFLTNGGFEDGTFNGWTVETHLWADSTFDFSGSPDPKAANYNPDYGLTKTFKPNTFTPGKSSVVPANSSPFDPFVLSLTNNATSLQMAQFGSKALRVNNEDNNYHISSATQIGTVPATTTGNSFTLKWAAVLEDPQHPYYDQPFVEVVVTDLNTNAVLYKKHFFSNDPRFSGGWVVLKNGSGKNTGWKMIDWQQADIDISKSKGHQVKVQVSAGDCNQGGHGGYAFVDIDQ